MIACDNDHTPIVIKVTPYNDHNDYRTGKGCAASTTHNHKNGKWIYSLQHFPEKKIAGNRKLRLSQIIGHIN